MSSVAGSINSERTNRWLLIGAAVLAVVAGALVFAALANFNDDNESGGSGGGAPSGSNKTLVATEDIAAGETLTASMFEVREYDAGTLVNDPVTDLEAVDGKVTSTEILKGNQLSAKYIQGGTSAKELEEQLPFLFDKGLRAIGLSTDDVKIAGGHVRPGDFVDVIWTVREKDSPNAEFEFQRIEYLFQDVEVLARTTQPVDGVVVLDDTGKPLDQSTDEVDIARRNDDVEPGDDASNVVLKLTPEQTLRLMSAVDLGEVTLSLRPYGDHEVRDIPPIRQPVFDQ